MKKLIITLLALTLVSYGVKKAIPKKINKDCECNNKMSNDRAKKLYYLLND